MKKKRKSRPKKVDWFGAPPKGKKNPLMFKPVKLATLKNTKRISKVNLTWPQARVRFPKLSPFGDKDRDGKLNMFDCRPLDKRRQDFGKFNRKGKRDVESFTAIERFGGGRNLKRLKHLGSGRDRRVKNLDKDKVIKIASNPGGIRQNRSEGDWFLNASDIRPKVYEVGKDYVIMEKVKKLGAKNRKKMRELKKMNFSYARGANQREDDSGMIAEELAKKFTKNEDFDTLGNYNLVAGDIIKESSWGENEDGSIVLIDAGGVDREGIRAEHRITKMRARLNELHGVPTTGERESHLGVMYQDYPDSYSKLRNERATLREEVKEWDEIKRDRAAFKDKGSSGERDDRLLLAGIQDRYEETFDENQSDTLNIPDVDVELEDFDEEEKE